MRTRIVIYYLLAFLIGFLNFRAAALERQRVDLLPRMQKEVKIELPPLLSSHRESPGYHFLSTPQIWGLPESTPEGDLANFAHAVEYVQKTMNNVEMICAKRRSNYCWEFYGFLRDKKCWLAIFFNPQILEWKLVSAGERLDLGLNVKKADGEEVILRTKAEEFKINLFGIELKDLPPKSSKGRANL